MLDSFSCLSIEIAYSHFTFCGACTLIFLAHHTISAKRAHPMDDLFWSPGRKQSHIYRPQRSWGKVMFLQESVILSTGGWCAWPGGVHGRGACMAGGGMHGEGGPCIAGGHAW